MSMRIKSFLLTGVVLGALTSVASAQSILDRLEKKLNEVTPAAPRPAPQAAAPGFLGLTADNKDGGVEVVSVRAGGPADQAGIKPGDRLVTAGGVELKSLDDMAGVVGRLPAGSRVDFVVNRSGRPQKIAVVLAGRNVEAVEPLPIPKNDLPPEAPLPEVEAGPAQLGVRAEPVTADLQRAYGLSIRRGAIIVSIVQGSPADRYGLPLGGAIVAVDGQRVDSPEDLAAIIGAARPGDTVELSYYQREQAFRKKVRLVPNNVVEAPIPAPGNDRPILRKLEKAIDSVVATPPAPLPGGTLSQIQTLQAQVQELQARIDLLERRLQKLEGPRSAPAEPKLEAPLDPLQP